MLKEFILFIKYPYTAGVIATIWLGTAGSGGEYGIALRVHPAI